MDGNKTQKTASKKGNEMKTNEKMRIDETQYGRLMDYATGEYIRPATPEEMTASKSAEASNIGGGTGVITIDGRSVYVL